VFGDASQERAQLEDAAAFGPRRMHRADVQTEEPDRRAGGRHFDECVSREPRAMPLGVRDRMTTEERRRLPGRIVLSRHGVM